MSATKLSAGLVLAATSGLLLITMTGTGFAQYHGGAGKQGQPSCDGSCQANKAGNPGTVLTNGSAAKGGVGNTSGSKTLRQK